jgi:hypothetical protein
MAARERVTVRELTAEEEAEAQRIADLVMARTRVEALELGRMLASKSNGQLLGETEFRVRDAVHRMGAVAIDAALEERKKKGTKDRASSVPTAEQTPGSKGMRRKR